MRLVKKIIKKLISLMDTVLVVSLSGTGTQPSCWFMTTTKQIRLKTSPLGTYVRVKPQCQALKISVDSYTLNPELYPSLTVDCNRCVQPTLLKSTFSYVPIQTHREAIQKKNWKQSALTMLLGISFNPNIVKSYNQRHWTNVPDTDYIMHFISLYTTIISVFLTFP